MNQHIKLDPDLIPHTEFHTGIWLRAVDRPGWYYFLKRRNPNIIQHREFYASVDPPLRKLVKFLHDNGIRTTPSCAGHHYSRRQFEKIYAGLERERGIIAAGGLKLHDVQTGEACLFQDKKYRLPWSQANFIAKAESYQRRGVIGLRFGRRQKVKAAILALKPAGISIRERDGIVFIFIKEERPQDNLCQWKYISEKVIEIFRAHTKA